MHVKSIKVEKWQTFSELETAAFFDTLFANVNWALNGTTINYAFRYALHYNNKKKLQVIFYWKILGLCKLHTSPRWTYYIAFFILCDPFITPEATIFMVWKKCMLLVGHVSGGISFPSVVPSRGQSLFWTSRNI